MNTFTVNNIEYNTNKAGNRYYKTEDGRKIRIGKDAYEQAQADYELAQRKAVEEAKEYGITIETTENGYAVMMYSEVVESTANYETAYNRVASLLEVVKQAKADEQDKVEEQEEPIDTPKKIKKARKPRRKNFAAVINWEGLEVGITEKQKDFMLQMKYSDYWENGLDSTLWVFSLVDGMTGQFENKPMSVGAMISTLREKGLLWAAVDRITDMGTGRSHNEKCVGLTEAGKEMARAIGLA